MGDGEGGDRGVIAGRLEALFARVTPLGRPYSLREAADGINESAGRAVVSFQYLSQIRDGKRRNPSIDVLEAVARWFGVPPSYFLDDEVAGRTDEDLRALAVMRDAGVRGIAFRADGLSQANLDLIVTLLEQMRGNEGLPPADPEGAGGTPPA